MPHRQQLKRPAGPILHAFLLTYEVGGIVLCLYAADQQVPWPWMVLLMASWIACSVKLGTDQDKRRGIVR